MSKKKKKQKQQNKKSLHTSSKKKIGKEKKLVSKDKQVKTPFAKQQRNTVIAAALLIVLTFIAYQPALDNSFVDWDDYTYVLENDLVTSDKTTVSDVFSRSISLNYHPLTILTMRWNNNTCPDCVNGISARPFILWNIILHILNAILVFVFIFSITKKNYFIAGFTALAFALHPMHVESVAWVSERKDVLYVFFFMLGLLSYNRQIDKVILKKEGDRTNYLWLGLAFLCFILSCLSKAMAVVFPLVMMLLYFWRAKAEKPFLAIKQTLHWKRLLEYLPFLGGAFFFGLMAIDVQSGGNFYGFLDQRSNSVALNNDAFSWFEKLQFASYGFWNYIVKFFVPLDLNTFHPYPSRQEFESNSVYLLSLIGFVLLIVAVIISLRKFKFIAFGLGFYLVTVALVLQFLSVGQVITAERYTYLPYVGLAFTIAYALATFLPKKTNYYVYGLAAIAAIAWLIQSRQQVDSWQDSESLWGNVIAIYGNSNKIEYAFSVRGNYRGKMASYWRRKNDPQKAEEFLQKAEADFQTAIRLNTSKADIYEGMGNIYGLRSQQQNDPELTQKALEMYSKAIELNPDKASAYINRGIAYSSLGQAERALQDMNMAVQKEQKPIHYLYRGIARQTLGDQAGAIADFQKTLQLEPGNQEALKRLQQLQAK